MKAKVSWTANEYEKIANWFLQSGIDPDNHGFSRYLREAQEAVLPHDRRRSMNGIPTSWKSEVKMAIARVEHALEALPDPENEDVPPSLAAIGTGELLAEVARRLAKAIDGVDDLLRVRSVDRGFHPLAPEKPGTCSQVIERPKILVVGPYGDQQSRLRDEFPQVELRFVKCDEKSDLAVSRSTGCRAILVWTRFTNHAIFDNAKLAAQREGVKVLCSDSFLGIRNHIKAACQQ